MNLNPVLNEVYKNDLLERHKLDIESYIPPFSIPQELGYAQRHSLNLLRHIYTERAVRDIFSLTENTDLLHYFANDQYIGPHSAQILSQPYQPKIIQYFGNDMITILQAQRHFLENYDLNTLDPLKVTDNYAKFHLADAFSIIASQALLVFASRDKKQWNPEVSPRTRLDFLMRIKTIQNIARQLDAVATKTKGVKNSHYLRSRVIGDVFNEFHTKMSGALASEFPSEGITAQRLKTSQYLVSEDLSEEMSSDPSVQQFWQRLIHTSENPNAYKEWLASFES